MPAGAFPARGDPYAAPARKVSAKTETPDPQARRSVRTVPADPVQRLTRAIMLTTKSAKRTVCLDQTTWAGYERRMNIDSANNPMTTAIASATRRRAVKWSASAGTRTDLRLRRQRIDRFEK